MKTGVYLILDFSRESVLVTALSNGGPPRQQTIAMTDIAAAVKEFQQWQSSLGPVAGVTVFIPSVLCRFRTGTFPSKDTEELREIFRLQFARSTPHGRDKMMIDVKILERVTRAQSHTVSVMVTEDSLTPVFLFCEEARLLPDIVTVDAQQLFVSGEKIWGKDMSTGGRIVVMVSDKTLHAALFVNGFLAMTREASVTEDIDRQLLMFIDHCRKALPEVSITAGLVFNDNAVEHIRDILGVPFASRKTPPARVFPDLASIEHVSRDRWFDLSPGPVVKARQVITMNRLLRQGMILGGLLLLGVIFMVVAGTTSRMSLRASLNKAIKGSAVEARDLEVKNKFLNGVTRFSEERILMSAALEDLSSALPVQVRLTECHLTDGKLSLKGESAALEAVRTFQEALSSKGRFTNVVIGGIDKHLKETGEVVVFTLTAEAKP